MFPSGEILPGYALNAQARNPQPITSSTTEFGGMTFDDCKYSHFFRLTSSDFL
jgi:hypothetical protein